MQFEVYIHSSACTAFPVPFGLPRQGKSLRMENKRASINDKIIHEYTYQNKALYSFRDWYGTENVVSGVRIIIINKRQNGCIMISVTSLLILNDPSSAPFPKTKLQIAHSYGSMMNVILEYPWHGFVPNCRPPIRGGTYQTRYVGLTLSQPPCESMFMSFHKVCETIPFVPGDHEMCS